MLQGLRWLCAALAVLISVALHATEVVTTLSGDGTLLGDTFLPSWLALDPAGDVFAVGGGGLLLLDIPHGTNTALTVAGSLSKTGFAGDGGPFTKALFTSLGGLATDSGGNVFVLDGTSLRRIDYSTGIITTVAGGATAGGGGDGGPATAAALDPRCPYSGLAIDAADNIFIADTGNSRIRRIDAKTGIIITVAGNGQQGVVTEGLPAVQSPLIVPTAVTVDAAGNVFFVELGGVNRVYRIDAQTQTVATVAGSGAVGTATSAGFSGDGGLAANAKLNAPFGLAIDPAGNLIIADSNNQRIRQVDHTSQIITTLAGGGTVTADGCLPKSAALFYPWGVAYDKSGNLLVADIFGFRIRELLAGSQTDTEDPDGDGFSNVIEAAANSNPNDASSTPFSQTAANALIEHCTLTAAFNVANASKVKLQMKGFLPALTAPMFANARVLCAFGGMTRVFTLDARGSAHSGHDTLRFTYSSKKELMTFQATIGAADFTQILTTGSTFKAPTNNREGVGLFVLFQNTIFSADVDLSFAARGANSFRVKGASSDFGIITGRH